MFDNLRETAERLGTEDGTAAASWFEFNDAHAAIIAGMEDCDPAVLDCLPFLDLSGQWADGVTSSDVLAAILEASDDETSDLATEDEDALIDAYQSAYDEAVSGEIYRMATYHVSREA